MARQFFYVQTDEGIFIVTDDGVFLAVEGGTVALLTFFADLRKIIIDEGYLPSMSPNSFDTRRGKRLHRQFWMSGRLVSSTSISQAADNVWEIGVQMAWEPSKPRSDADFGLFEMLDAIGSLNNAIQSRQCATWDEPVNIASATPEWDDELKAWSVAIIITTQERRSWAPTS